nr:uncharacterized protein LOC129385367 isoform X2 [Dermacentor andersoni]
MTSTSFASFHILVELVMLTSIWSSHVLESKVYPPKETLHGSISRWHGLTDIIEPRMALWTSPIRWRSPHGTPGEPASDPCPPEGRNACAHGVPCIWTNSTTMCLCTCASSGVTTGSG